MKAEKHFALGGKYSPRGLELGRCVLEQLGEDASINRCRLTDRATGSSAILGLINTVNRVAVSQIMTAWAWSLTTSAAHG
ncbi:MAG TPA: hypothetical protein DEH10_05100 [Pseudomonas sp.]|nr:hypothetical protein [Pseudomonas sp.]